MESKNIKKEHNVLGLIFVLLSAVCFSLGGILIKLIPWGSVSINGARCFFALIVLIIYMKINKHKFKINKTVVFGAVCNFLMAITFVMATKMTSAANAIVLQFTEPIFVILAMWLIFKRKPSKNAIIACVAVFFGILCFFLEKLTLTGMIGNLLAIFSGLTYSGVFLIKSFKDGDFESSLLISHLMSIAVGIPYLISETEFNFSIWVYVILLGAVQLGFAYIFLSKGLDRVSAVTASLTSTIEPILNPILVAIFYGETIGFVSIIGAAIVIFSATAYNLAEAKKG